MSNKKLSQQNATFDAPWEEPTTAKAEQVQNNGINRKAIADSLMTKYFGNETLEKALAQIPHKAVQQNGEPMSINNIYFLLKVSEAYAEIIRKAYPYQTFMNDRGIEIPGREADQVLVDITKDILTAESIPFTDEYLQIQLNKLNKSYGF